MIYKSFLFFFFKYHLYYARKKFKESFLEMPRRIEYNISLNFNGTSKCLGFPPFPHMEITVHCWEAGFHGSSIIKPS